MPYRYLLPLLFLPLLAPAQQGPPVNMRLGQVLQLSTADIPVDVALVNQDGFNRSPRLAVVAQGSDRLYAFDYDYFSGLYGLSPRSFPTPSPQCLLPLALPRTGGARFTVENLLVLGTNGNLTRWRYTGTAYALSPPLALRGGLACAPTDRFLTGRYAPNSLGDDVVLWSDGPQPGLATARHLGGGAYQLFAPPTRALLPAPQPLAGVPTGAATANLSYFSAPTTYPEALFLTLPGNPAGDCRFWLNNNNVAQPDWWATATGLLLPSLAGPCTGLAVGTVDGTGTGGGAGAMDCVFLSNTALTLRFGRGEGRPMSGSPYVLEPGAETYPVLFVPREVRLADLNNDQRPELLVLGTNGTLNIFENTTLRFGRTTPFNSIPYVFNTGPDPATIRLGDLDADGDPDIIVPCRGDNSVRLFLNDRIVLGTARQAAARLALAVYPTPATTVLTVRWAAPGGGNAAAPAALLDALGRTVREWPALAPGTTLDVAGLPRGVYALRVQAAGGSATRRVVLE